MATAYTSLLGLALPVTGDLTGIWGDTVNNGITSLVDSAVAGTTTLSADTTLTTTTGTSNQARQAILLCTGHVANITITAPAQSKIYTVINASATYTVKIRGVGPTTGITIPVSSTATVAWNGSDFVDASGYINGNLKVNGTLSVTGVATFSAGTAALPAITTTGDTNTGIWFPAADTIAFAEGGVESMRIDASGNLGIGDTSPPAPGGADARVISLKGTLYPQFIYTATGASADGRVYRTMARDSGVFQIQTLNDLLTSEQTAYEIVRNSGLLTINYHRWFSGSSEAMRLDSSGNLGIGTSSPSTFGKVAVQVAGTTTPTSLTNVGPSSINLYATTNGGSTNGTTGIFGWTSTTGLGSGIGFSRENGGDWGTQIRFYTHPTATTNIGDITERMRLDSSGNLGIGTSSPAYKLDVSGEVRISNGGDSYVGFGANKDNYWTTGTTSGKQVWRNSGGTEFMQLDSSGNLIAATSNATLSHKLSKGAVTARFQLQVGESYPTNFYEGSAYGFNVAATVLEVPKNNATSRSINAGGTINASGADYAEYMTKAGDFTIAKGDVVGIDAQGKLTNVFANAVSFVVKSTDPSYVGGDVWGSESALGLPKPKQPSQRQATEEVEAETDEEFAVRQDQYEDDKTAFDAALEAARQTVDRIAFAGQVPVNVMGATAGQYIIPVNDNGAIKGEAVSNPTFEQYQTAVGKVIAIESDGRAKIIVKVA